MNIKKGDKVRYKTWPEHEYMIVKTIIQDSHHILIRGPHYQNGACKYKDDCLTTIKDCSKITIERAIKNYPKEAI